MNIEQINVREHFVSFGKTSITVKSRATGKTVGVIRDAVRMSNGNRSPRQDFELCQKFRKAGIDWRAVGFDRTVLHDGKVYLFHDMRLLEVRETCRALYDLDNAGGRMDTRLADDKAIFDAARAAGFPVIEYMPYRDADRHEYR